jgi:hypothetical protein
VKPQGCLFYITPEAIMKRAQIYLTNDEWRQLSLESSSQNVPISELIRRAVDQVYGHGGSDDLEQAMRDAAGLWKDRTDIGDTDEYVRFLREDDRMQRLG